MDKRTLIFAVFTLAAFFGINLYFGYQRDQHRRETLKQKEVLEEKHLLFKKEDIQKRTESFENLPLVPIYENQNIVAWGVDVKGKTLTISWEKNLPTTVMIQGQTQTLLTKDPLPGDIVLYAFPQFRFLEIAALPDEGVYDLQLVLFPEGETPQIQLIEYQGGRISFPQEGALVNGIALYKTDEGYLPLGFYQAQGNWFIELQQLPLFSSLAKPLAPKPSPQETQPLYYVLENEYQQLVFSNVGGALTEINLPFTSADNSKSVVKEIGFDRELAKDFPQETRFPQHPYFTFNSSSPQPEGPVGGYYPLIRRGHKHALPAQYAAFNIVSDYPEVANLIYEVSSFSRDRIVFEAKQPHRKISKIYSFPEKEAPYCFDLTIKVEGDSRNLWLSSGVPEVEIMSNTSSPQIQYRLTRKGKAEVEKLSLPKAKELINVSSIYPDWIVNSNGYLGLILDPLNEISAGYKAKAIPGNLVPTRLSLLDPKYRPYPASKYPGYQVLLPLPSRGGTSHFRVYAGPFEENTLKAVDRIYTNPQTGENPDYSASRTFYGWFSFISKPFAKLLFLVMKFFYSLTHSWAFAIILLTVFLRILLYPLNAWSIKSMRRMQQISPEIQAIQQKYKKDPKKAQMEIMHIYREKKVNPFMGCIPILIQLPFLIAMFDLLKSSFQLRGASFIPGWIDNLTAPDVLFQWKQPIFFIGNQFHLLPILLGVVMLIQQNLTKGPTKPNLPPSDQRRQQKAMGTMMTIFFTVMFYHFPSGLNLYWLSSMLLGILQQWITNKILDKKARLSPKKKQMKKHLIK